MNNKSERIAIIGGGFSGLFAGALLSKEGYNVTLIEKNSNIGGGLQSFQRRGVSFDTGMHILGGFREGGSLWKICKYLGILGKLDVRNTDACCMDSITYLSDNVTYRIPEGKEPFIEYFQKMFPHESDNIRNYVDHIFTMVSKIDFFFLRPDKKPIFSYEDTYYEPADKMIERYIQDPKLREIIAYMSPMCGGVAGHTPAYVFALINVLYINGQSRFEGPYSQLADALAETIAINGGKTLANQTATRLNISDGKVVSVETDKGLTVEAEKFISAIHPTELLKLTDSKIFSKAYRKRVNELTNSYSAFSVYIIFKPSTFKYINHTCYCQNDYSKTWHLGDYNAETWPDAFVYTTPCEKEQGQYAKKMEIIAIMPYNVCAKWENTITGRRGEEYAAWKNLHLEMIIRKMEMLYPGFNSMIEHVYCATPLTIRDFYNTPKGSIYGIMKDSEHLMSCFVSIGTKVSNLYLTGQNTNLHGCCGVPLSALSTAETIAGEDVILEKINRMDE